MAEKRRAGAVMSDSASAKCENDREFLSQAGVSALLRGALLKLVESRPEDPVGFLAEHFAHLSSEVDDGGSEHQAVSRALWHLSLAHHSQRSDTIHSVTVCYSWKNAGCFCIFLFITFTPWYKTIKKNMI